MINIYLPFAIPPAARHRHKMIMSGSKMRNVSYNPQKRCAEREFTMLKARRHMKKHGLAPVTTACRALFIVGLKIPKSWSKQKKQDAVDLKLFPDASKRNDFDNLAKFVCDCLNNICFDDDGRIVDGRLIKIYSEKPFTKIIIDNEFDLTEFKAELLQFLNENIFN